MSNIIDLVEYESQGTFHFSPFVPYNHAVKRRRLHRSAQHSLLSRHPPSTAKIPHLPPLLPRRSVMISQTFTNCGLITECPLRRKPSRSPYINSASRLDFGSMLKRMCKSRKYVKILPSAGRTVLDMKMDGKSQSSGCLVASS